MKQNVTKKRPFFASENPDITVSLAKYSYDKIWPRRHSQRYLMLSGYLLKKISETFIFDKYL